MTRCATADLVGAVEFADDPVLCEHTVIALAPRADCVYSELRRSKAHQQMTTVDVDATTMAGWILPGARTPTGDVRPPC